MKKKIYVNSGVLQKQLHMYEENDLCEQWYSAKKKKNYTCMKKKIYMNSGTLRKQLHMYEEKDLSEQWHSAHAHKKLHMHEEKDYIPTVIMCTSIP